LEAPGGIVYVERYFRRHAAYAAISMVAARPLLICRVDDYAVYFIAATPPMLIAELLYAA